MSLVERLEAKVKQLDRRVIASLSHGYDQRAADDRELLEEAISIIRCYEFAQNMERWLHEFS